MQPRKEAEDVLTLPRILISPLPLLSPPAPSQQIQNTMSPTSNNTNRDDAAGDALGFLPMIGYILNLNRRQTNTADFTDPEADNSRQNINISFKADSNMARSANTNGGTAAAGVEVQATWNNEGADPPETAIDEPPAPAHDPENLHYWNWIGNWSWSRKGKFVAAAAAVLGTFAVGTAFGVFERENLKMKANQNTAMIMMPKAPKSNSPRPPQTKASKLPPSESSSLPSSSPSIDPSGVPSLDPSFGPSSEPSSSSMPSDEPSSDPSSQPSSAPSSMPSDEPSSEPSSMPSDEPSSEPSISSEPSSMPSGEPSSEPSLQPSESAAPSCSPSSAPTESPSKPPGVNLFYPEWVSGSGRSGCR